MNVIPGKLPNGQYQCRCGLIHDESALIVVASTFKNGTQHRRASCPACGQYIQFLPIPKGRQRTAVDPWAKTGCAGMFDADVSAALTAIYLDPKFPPDDLLPLP